MSYIRDKFSCHDCNEKDTGERQRLLRSDGAVLITGGLGGIGKHVARSLASAHSVRDLVLVSRRGMETPGAAELISELAALGTEAAVISCDIARIEDAKSVMAMFDSEKRPLRGIVHAAGAQDNGVISAMTPHGLATALRGKLDGAWHLHQLTPDMNVDLDLFVVFSSTFGIIGMPGHASYAAANTFPDSLAQSRHAQGLPATSIAYGVWEMRG